MVEDFAQAFGVKSRGRPLGSYGVVGITSFGKLKMLDAGGGGALVTDSEEIAERARAFRATLQAPGLVTRTLMAALHLGSCAYGRVVALRRQCGGTNLNSISAWVERLFLRQLSAERAAKISADMEWLDDILRTRRQRVQLISSLLNPKAHCQLGYDLASDPPLTMYTTLLPRASSFRDYVKQKTAGLYGLYPPAHRFFGGQAAGPVSESLTNRLINLPIVPGESVGSLSAKCRRLALAMES
jgi:dTDP-4-amino-4,6-dideoxygalactose transaminase